jgi:hypothetical protein
VKSSKPSKNKVTATQVLGNWTMPVIEDGDLEDREIPHEDEPKQRLKLLLRLYLRKVRNKPY